MSYCKDTAYLTPRELEIVQLLVQGYNTKQVAHCLKLSPNTIGQHLNNAYHRLHATHYTLVYRAHLMGCIK